MKTHFRPGSPLVPPHAHHGMAPWGARRKTASASARAFLAAVLMTGAALAAPGTAQAQEQPISDGSIMAAIDQLQPGQFLWAPQIAPEGPLLLIVNLTTQRLVVYRNGVPIGVSTVSTGRAGHRTPTGVFTILQKQVRHFSSIYDNAPMPFMQRLTWQGVALHAGNLPGYPASHGCIRLPAQFAELLYGVTALGITVVITDQPSLPRLAPAPEITAQSPLSDIIGGDADAIEWHPERAPDGPVSVLVSGADRRVAVLRNGIVIGNAPVTIDGPAITRVAAYQLRAVDADGYHWVRIPLSAEDAPETTASGANGTPTDAPAANGTPVSGEEQAAADRAHFHVDAAFRRDAESVIAPGTTVIVMPDSLAAGGAGTPMTVIEEEGETPDETAP